MSESKYPDWYHGPRGPSDEVKAQRKISAQLKRIEAKLDAVGTAPREAQADPQKGHSPYVTEEGHRYYVPDITPPGPAPVPQTEGEAILNRHQDKAVKESAIYKAMTEGECPQCGGDGKGPLTHHFGEPCPTCSGTGKEKA